MLRRKDKIKMYNRICSESSNHAYTQETYTEKMYQMLKQQVKGGETFSNAVSFLLYIYVFHAIYSEKELHL